MELFTGLEVMTQVPVLQPMKNQYRYPAVRPNNAPIIVPLYFFIISMFKHIITAKVLGQAPNFCNFGHRKNAQERVNLTG